MALCTAGSLHNRDAATVPDPTAWETEVQQKLDQSEAPEGTESPRTQGA